MVMPLLPWTSNLARINIASPMRRELVVIAKFEPTRQGIEHLRQTYEALVPTTRRRVVNPDSGSSPAPEAQQEPDLRRDRFEETAS